MHLDPGSVNHLKEWTARKLKPICDADPTVLSDYVIALLMHDQPEADLRLLCLKQLEDFLSQDTRSFVTELFEHLQLDAKLNSNRKSTQTDGSVLSSLGKRSLTNELVYLPPTPSSSLADRPPATFPIPEYTPTQSHPSFLHFPEQESRVFEIPTALPNSPSQPYVSASLNSRSSKRPRRSGICRDYHFRGYCSRGDVCLYSHDDGNSNPSKDPAHVPAYNPSQPNGELDPSASAPRISSQTHLTPHNSQTSGLVGPLPLTTDFLASILSAAPAPALPEPSLSSYSRGPDASGRHGQPPFSHKSRTTLVVENIPQTSLSDRSVREYFSHFGPLVSVSVNVYNAQAIVVFQSADDAKRAHSSPEPVFNNRFVKIHYKRLPVPDSQPQRDVRPEKPARRMSHGVGSRHGSAQPCDDFNGFGNTRQPLEKTVPLSNNLHSRAPPSTAKLITQSLTLSEKERQLRIQIDAQKRLLEELSLKKAKKVSTEFSSLAGTREKESQKSEITEANMKPCAGKLQNSDGPNGFECSRKDSAGDDLELPSGTGVQASKPIENCPVLDRAPEWPAIRGGGWQSGFSRGFVGNTRTSWSANATPTKSFKLDNRSSTLAVRQVPDFSSREIIKGYFEQFGSVLSLAPLGEDGESPDFTVKFANRASAEKALSQGAEIPDVGKVSMSWVSTPPCHPTNAYPHAALGIPGLRNSTGPTLSQLARSPLSTDPINADDCPEENGEADGWKR